MRQRMFSECVALGCRRPVLVFGATAFIWAVVVMMLNGYHDRPPFAEEANLAWHIAKGYGFRSPFLPSRGAPLSAWSPPLYPLVIAATWKIFGIGSTAAVTALMAVNAAFFGLIVAAAAIVAKSLFRSWGPGMLAGLLLAIHPSFLFGMGDFWDGFMSLAMFTWLCVAALQSGQVSAGVAGDSLRGAVLGVGMGFLALTNTSYVPTFPVLLIMAFRHLPKGRRWYPVVAACLVCLMLLTPWTMRHSGG